MPKEIRAVIFDMDGVITHTMPYHYRIWKKIFHREGLPVSRYEVYSREGQKGLDSVLELFAKYGRTISRKQAQALLAEKETLFKETARTRFVPGSRSFVKKCRAQGFSLALVTGTSRDELCQILPKKIADLFHVIVTGSDVRRGKPHPEPYQKALKLLKADARESVVIENAPFGITSALQAGIFCVALRTSLPASYLKEADKIADDYCQLERFWRANFKIKEP